MKKKFLQVCKNLAVCMTNPGAAQLRKTLKHLRNLLRTYSVTGIQALEHICYLFFMKVAHIDWTFMTESPEIREKFEMLDKQLQSSDNDTFKLRDLTTNIDTDILSVINSIDIVSIGKELDVIGFIYESFIKTGACCGSRDMGQFFTNRCLCRLVIEWCNPQEGESICDPAMGTGGFLVSYLEYMKLNKLVVDAGLIYGYDIDPFVAKLARMNMFIQSGGQFFEHLECRDSLSYSLHKKHDVFFCNMPFGIKKYPYANCSSIIKELEIKGTHVEPLFIQLIVQSLKPGGRAAVIVPDTFLSSKSPIHKSTRQYLFENTCLTCVVKLTGKFFMNTTIEPSILFFSNTPDRPNVEFWSVEKEYDQDNERAVKKFLFTVSRNDIINEQYMLASKLYTKQQLITTPFHEGYPILPLSKICNISRGSRFPVGNTRQLYPYYEVGGVKRFVGTYISDDDLLMTPCVLNIGRFFYMNEKCNASDNLFVLQVINKEELSTKFLYYYSIFFLSNRLKDLSRGVKPMISISTFDKVYITLIPLEMQKKVVILMDDATLTRPIESMRDFTCEWINAILLDDKHFSHLLSRFDLYVKTNDIRKDITDYIEDIISERIYSLSNIPSMALEKIVQINPEKAHRMSKIRYIDLSSVKKGIIANLSEIKWDEKPTRAIRHVRGGDIIWGTVRPLMRSHAIIPENLSVHDNVVVSNAFVVIRNIRSDIILSEYLYMCLITKEYVDFLNKQCSGIYPTFNAKTILQYEIKIPSLTWQKHFLEKITGLRKIDEFLSFTLSDMKYIPDEYITTPDNEQQC